MQQSWRITSEAKVKQALKTSLLHHLAMKMNTQIAIKIEIVTWNYRSQRKLVTLQTKNESLISQIQKKILKKNT